MKKHIAESFQQYFEMVPATTESLKEAAYRVRYQIYCLETGFEDSDKFPSGLEKDEYDDTSDHYLIRHRETGVYAATTRLILADPDHPQRPFPMERRVEIDHFRFSGEVFRRRLAEVSRFCVSKQFRRRSGERGTTTGVGAENVWNYLASEDERRTFPHITLALIACLIRMSVRHGVLHWYGFMDIALIRLLKLIGISSTVIGPMSDFHGRRQPCLIEVAELLERVKKRNPQVWDMLTDYGRLWQSHENEVRPAPRDLRAANVKKIPSERDGLLFS